MGASNRMRDFEYANRESVAMLGRVRRLEREREGMVRQLEGQMRRAEDAEAREKQKKAEGLALVADLIKQVEERDALLASNELAISEDREAGDAKALPPEVREARLASQSRIGGGLPCLGRIAFLWEGLPFGERCPIGEGSPFCGELPVLGGLLFWKGCLNCKGRISVVLCVHAYLKSFC
ncbi:MAG: hypothetical protein SGPRY_013513 [Prymnesium sp.]